LERLANSSALRHVLSHHLARDLRRAEWSQAFGRASSPENLFSVLLFLTAIPSAFRCPLRPNQDNQNFPLFPFPLEPLILAAIHGFLDLKCQKLKESHYEPAVSSPVRMVRRRSTPCYAS